MVDDVREVENRQEHTDHHAADDDAEEDDEQRLDERHEAGERAFNFLVEEVGDAFKHGVNVAGLFTGAQHADNHRGENWVFGEGGGDAFAALDVAGGGLDGFFHDGIADGLRNDLQHFQNRHAAADQGRERAGETREANFMGDGAEDGELDALAIPKFTAGLGFYVGQPRPDSAAGEEDEHKQVMFHDIADADEKLRGAGQLGAEAAIDVLEGGNDAHEQEDGDDNGHDGDDGRIHQRGFNFFTQAFRVFEIGCEPRENFREQAAFFAGRDHCDIQAVEGFRMAGECLGKTFSALDASGDIANDIAHDFVGCLVAQRLERLDDGDAGVNHRGELPGKNYLVGEGNFAAFGLTALGDFFLNFDDQEVAVQQRSDGGLLGKRLHSVADFAAGGRFAGGVSKYRHT